MSIKKKGSEYIKGIILYDTFYEELSKEDYDLVVKFFPTRVKEDTLVEGFKSKKTGKFLILVVIDFLKLYKEFLIGRIKGRD